MKNVHLDHERFIDTYLHNRCCRLAITVLILALMATVNLWWFLSYEGNQPQPNNYDPPALKLPAAATEYAAFCSSRSKGNKSCDIFKGMWVPDPSPPPYTNDTCPYIFPNQNCMTNGRPDRGFLHWKWKPHDCEIPAFDPALFLRLMTGKKMIFVGDSLARNQMQSLLCLISQVEIPEDLGAEYYTPEEARVDRDHQGIDYAWSFPSYNFSLFFAWSPYLVNYTVEEGTGTYKIHLDRPDQTWTSVLLAQNFEVAVFSSMYWFFRRSVYYVNGKSVSEYDSGNLNVTSTEEVHAMKRVWRTVWKYLVKSYGGIAILRTVSVSHFEDNAWDKGGTCSKTQPEFDPHRNMSLPWLHNEVLNLQKKEFKRALRLAASSNSSCRPKLLEVTYNTLLRPDGHPSSYRIQRGGEARNDCGHWCLPGAIDTWNRLLLADPQFLCSSS